MLLGWRRGRGVVVGEGGMGAGRNGRGGEGGRGCKVERGDGVGYGWVEEGERGGGRQDEMIGKGMSERREGRWGGGG